MAGINIRAPTRYRPGYRIYRAPGIKTILIEEMIKETK